MKLEYELRSEDLKAFADYCVNHDPAVTAKTSRIQAIVAVAIGGVFSLVWALSGQKMWFFVGF